jgi:hypothetical protein
MLDFVVLSNARLGACVEQHCLSSHCFPYDMQYSACPPSTSVATECGHTHSSSSGLMFIQNWLRALQNLGIIFCKRCFVSLTFLFGLYRTVTSNGFIIHPLCDELIWGIGGIWQGESEYYERNVSQYPPSTTNPTRTAMEIMPEPPRWEFGWPTTSKVIRPREIVNVRTCAERVRNSEGRPTRCVLI